MLNYAKLFQNNKWSTYTPFCYIMIIRGIGYRAYHITNDFNSNIEFDYNSYLIIRAGHTVDLCQALPNDTKVFITKKDRKLVIYSKYKIQLNYFATTMSLYRKPSVYTGRGIRIKGVKLIRKAGKKDKQKGKAF